MKRPGVHEIARRAGVSIGTVDRALHGRAGISKATREKILAIAKDLAYVPHPAARALSARRNVRIGVCIPREIHFFYDQMRAGIFDEARRHDSAGVEVVYRPVVKLGEGEAQKVKELLEAGVQGLLLVPGSPEALTPIISRAEDKGVRVACVSTDAPRSWRSTVVCVDPLMNGHLAAELMSKFVPEGAHVAILTGMLGTEDHRLKTQGFSEGFAEYCMGGRILTVIEAHESAKESYHLSRALLRDYSGLSGIYVNTVNCLPVCRALEEKNLSGKIKLVTTDLFRKMELHFYRNTIQASIYQDPYLQGQTALRLLAEHLVSGTPLPSAHYINPGVVMETTLPLFREMQ
jgi:LacI family transcriptional regulator